MKIIYMYFFLLKIVLVVGRRIILTNVDNGRTIPIGLGDDVEVRLTGIRDHGLTYTWSIPQSNGNEILRRISGGTTPTGGSSSVFHAENEGIATITDGRKCHPDSGRVCPLVITPWKIVIDVK